MKHELKRIAPVHTALVVGFITFLMVWCLYLADWIKFLMNSQFGEPKVDGLFTSSCILSFVSFLSSLVACFAYNVLAKLIGGIKYEVDQDSQNA